MQTYFGYIYLPHKDELQKIESVRLCIDGDKFWLEGPIKLFGVEKYNLIKGAFTSLGFVTLLECNFLNNSSGIGGYYCELSINYIISGIQFENEVNLTFSGLKIKMPSLKKWLKKSVYKGDFIFDKKVEIEFPQTIDFGTFHNFVLSADFGITQNWNTENSLSVKDYVTLEIKTISENLSLWELLDIYKKFKKFLAFINVFDEGLDILVLKEDNIIYKNQDKPLEMKFFMSSFNFKNKGLDDIEVPKYEDIENEIKEILDKWFNYNELFDSIDLILEKYYQSKLSRETFFLNSSFAIEIYHRRFMNNDCLPKSEFKKIKNAIISKLETPEEIKLFKDRLAFANEPSFRDRLESLKDDFQMILPSNFIIEDYIKKIVRTRNYIVHRSSNEHIFLDLELYYAACYLEALSKLLIYKEIGFSPSQILKMFKHTNMHISGLFILNNKLQTGIKKK